MGLLPNETRKAEKSILVAYFCPMRILMVCLGNICRSPMAEGILRHRARAAGLDWEVDSAGTNGYHIGEAPHPLSQKVAKLHGLDISGQRSRKFLGDDFQRFDLIYAMAGDVLDEMRRIAGRKFDASRAVLLMHEVDPDRDTDVPDPWSGPEPEYEEAFVLMDEACKMIVERVGGKKTASGKWGSAGGECGQGEMTTGDPAKKGTDAARKGGRHD